MTGPLKGIRVLEFASFHAAPGGGTILADLGAEVIKIEPRGGDPQRKWRRSGAFTLQTPDGENYIFQISNRGKLGIALDIENTKGRKVLTHLIEKSDVFLTNLRDSTLTKQGLQYKDLSKNNPRIVYARISGYGPEGEESDLGAYDFMAQAKSGFMTLAGDESPRPVGFAVVDQAASITVTHAIMTALYVRERTGEGQEIQVSLLGSSTWLLYVNLMLANIAKVEMPAWHRPDQNPLRNTFFCKDGEWIMGTNHPPEKYWETLCRATGMEHLLDDSRFDTDQNRWAHNSELVALFDQAFATKTQHEWIPLLRSHGLLFAPVQSCTEYLDDPQAHANQYIVDVDHPDFGPSRIPSLPIRYSKTPVRTSIGTPKLGQHTETVLQDVCGYTPQQIEQLRQEGVI